ncbi:MAG TPA: alanine dehydrogenase [archaeon]|nr:alanine dehydrogenase [archaeon]
MNVGVLKEIKDNEYRVALTPEGAKRLKAKGAKVFVEKGAGEGSGFADKEYIVAGAKISSVKEILKECSLIMKIKEPVKRELEYFSKKHTLFTYFHFASGKKLTQAMLKSGANCIAYETVSGADGKGMPLLAPMSRVAGRMSAHIGAYYLAKPNGGRGILLQGIEGVAPAKVVVLGGGTAGSNAADVALGMGGDVTIIQRQGKTFGDLVQKFPKAKIVESTPENVEREVLEADLVIGSIYVSGEKAKHLVSKKLVKKMKAGSVIVDIAIDQGGCIETSKPTTHSNPTFKVGEVTHYCVANMPGAFPRTSTFGITNATLPYAEAMVEQGVEKALNSIPGFKSGVNIWQGKLCNEGVAKAHNMKFERLPF